jgi:hypothetical protein
MGVSTSARGDSSVILLGPGSKADTAAASSGWVQIGHYKGEALVTAIFGTVVGTVAGKIQTATDSGGTGAADVTGATFTSVTSSNDDASYTIAVPKSAGPYIRYVGTVTTGPAALAVILQAHPGVV